MVVRFQNESGISLLESITALFVLSIVFTSLIPIWATMESTERIAGKMNHASKLAIDEIEKAHSGKFHVGSWTVTEYGEAYKVHTKENQELGAQYVKVDVFFEERGKNHAVSYETVVPQN